MILCYVTDRKNLPGAGTNDALVEVIRRAARAWTDWVQLREKDLLGRELFELAQQSVAACRENAATRLVVNDRLDVAIAAGAAGVHLGRESLPASEVVRWCRSGHAPAKFLVGVSCHSREEVIAAESEGANYAFFGPVFDTPAKQRFGAPRGLARLSEACRSVRIPVLAIGGIQEQNAPTCLEAGAAGIAAIRLFQNTRNADELCAIVGRLKSLSREK